MKCTIEILENPDFSHLRLSGLSSLPLEKKFIKEVCEIIISKANPLVLIDVSSLPPDTTITEDFYDASKVARMLGGKIRKLAILETEKRKDFIEFFETVARNRGLFVKIFFDETEAIAWLKQPRPVTKE